MITRLSPLTWGRELKHSQNQAKHARLHWSPLTWGRELKSVTTFSLLYGNNVALYTW